jgi:RecB family exonuclease
MKHYLKGPSSASRWLECGASLNYPYAEERGDAASAGTKWHDEALRCFEGHEDSEDESVNKAIAKVHTILAEYHGVDVTLSMERTLVSSTDPTFGGTPDIVVITADTLHVVDYKSGFKYVPAEDNKQLAAYLILARERYPGRTVFKGSIIQPNIESYEHAEYTAEQLDEIAAEIASVNLRQYSPGQHCQYCPGLAECPSAGAVFVDLIDCAD